MTDKPEAATPRAALSRATEPANCWSEGQSHDFIGGKCIKCGATEPNADTWLEIRESAAQPEGWVPPQEATPEMIESVASILQPYAAKLVWKRMLEMSLIAPKGKP